MDISEKIIALKQEKDITFLAHFYQTLEVQLLADYIGDSLGLAKIAKNNIKTGNILFAGVLFMAETASILNQKKTVLIPEKNAGCPMANQLTPEIIKQFKSTYPNLPVIVYVNTTAETKAEADVCCTSSNAVKIVQKVAQEWNTDRVLFGPDKNLGAYIQSQTNIKTIIMPPNGNCPVHNLYTVDDVNKARKANPDAKLLIHPESPASVLLGADYVGSTAGIENFVQIHQECSEFIIGTEMGMLDYLHQKYPTKKFVPLCERSVCKNMKKITLEKILSTLEAIGTPIQSEYEVRVPEDVAIKASLSIDKMLSYS